MYSYFGQEGMVLSIKIIHFIRLNSDIGKI